jgi:hypothetical protein
MLRESVECVETPTARPHYLTQGERQLFPWHHPARPGVRRGAARSLESLSVGPIVRARAQGLCQYQSQGLRHPGGSRHPGGRLHSSSGDCPGARRVGPELTLDGSRTQCGRRPAARRQTVARRDPITRAWRRARIIKSAGYGFSGAWHAFCAAKDGLQVDGTVSVNPPLDLRDGVSKTTRSTEHQQIGSYRRAMHDPARWRRVLRGRSAYRNFVRFAGSYVRWKASSWLGAASRGRLLMGLLAT